MSTLARRKMTVDEILAWAEGREGHYHRQADGMILTSIVHESTLALSPPERGGDVCSGMVRVALATMR